MNERETKRTLGSVMGHVHRVSIFPESSLEEAGDTLLEVRRLAQPGLFLEFVGRVRRHYLDSDGPGSRNLELCRDGYYFDAIIRQQPLDEDHLDPQDWAEQFSVFTDEDRATFNAIFAKLAERGCDAVVMGCTEIPILMDGVDFGG